MHVTQFRSAGEWTCFTSAVHWRVENEPELTAQTRTSNVKIIAVNSPSQTEVLIVGAGPVGLTLALDLGRRGVRCMVIERNETSIQLPKMERCNARTMEIYRRLGVAEQIRDAGLPRDAPMDVFLAPSMAEAPIAHLP